MATTDAYVTPGHPVRAGAGYDCQCGECLYQRGQRGEHGCMMGATLHTTPGAPAMKITYHLTIDGPEQEVTREEYDAVAPADPHARWAWSNGTISGRALIVVPPPDAAELAEAAEVADELRRWEGR